MPDLDERFATLDRIPVPDLRAERASDGSPDGTPTPPFGWGLGRRLGVIATAFLVFGAAVAYGWHAVTSTPAPPIHPHPAPVADPLAGIATGWTQLSDPPQQPQGAASVWTGMELVEWGGY